MNLSIRSLSIVINDISDLIRNTMILMSKILRLEGLLLLILHVRTKLFIGLNTYVEI